MTADSASPLTGLTIIELGHSVAAPFAGQILADLGAEVIKVENPDRGDDARSWGPPFLPDGNAATFHAMNRNKCSISVNLKDEAERKALALRMSKADVVLQNMRPGLVARYELDAPHLRALNPQLIYCNLSAFGATGPLRDAPGYDPLIQAFCGIMAVTGHADSPPIRVAPSIIDQGAGMWCVIGILSALLRRKETGDGCVVDSSLFETGLSWMSQQLVGSQASGRDTRKVGSETPILAPYRAYTCADQPIMIAAGNNNLFAKLCAVLDAPEWASDPRFFTNAARVENRKVLNDLIEDVTRQKPATHWQVVLDAVSVPCALVQSVSEVLAHPQTDATGMLLGDGAVKLVATPIRFDGQRATIRHPVPTLDQI